MKKRLLSGLVAALLACSSMAPAATLLPQGRQTFFGADGLPLVSGFVYFYQLGSQSTPKTTWKDSAQTQPNTNPVQLDSSGSATIYGSGSYQEVVTDASGNVIWNQPTADTSSVSNTWLWGGTSTGSANAQVVSIPSFSSVTGQLVSFVAGFTNNSVMSLNGFNVVKDTPAGPVSLTGGEVVAGNSVTVVFDPTLQEFHMVEPPIYPPLWGGGTATIASAATVDLCSAPNAMIFVTGSATINSFGSSCLVGQMKMVQFQGAITLTNSVNLVLPHAANLTTASGDWGIMSYTSAGVWQLVYFSTKAASAPQVTVLTSGSGTYTTPSGALYLEVEMCGGGSGGSGGGTLSTGGAGGVGGDTTFGSLTAHGGPATPVTGTGTLPTPATASGGDINISGGLGQANQLVNTTNYWYQGGQGATSPLGDGGTGSFEYYNGASTSSAGSAGTGFCSGGGGGSIVANGITGNTGWGGNAGAYLKKLLTGLSATYSYSVGGGGTAGTAGTSGSAGFAGAGGVIRVVARFQ